MPVSHYENFPVASWLVPAPLRKPIEAIYAFARGADDIADEGDFPASERLEGLARYARALDEIEAGIEQGESPFREIQAAIRDHALPVALLRDLLDAFRQDVVCTRYATHDELLDYCRRSANPVGRLVLHLFTTTGGVRLEESPGEPASLDCSDAICTSLQLINFWQDIAVDWRKGRLYIPLEDLARFGVREADVAEGRADARWRDLLAFECERSRTLLRSGTALGRRLPGRLGLEIRATMEGGAAILDKIDAVRGDVFRHRPVLRAGDWIRILARSL